MRAASSGRRPASQPAAFGAAAGACRAPGGVGPSAARPFSAGALSSREGGGGGRQFPNSRPGSRQPCGRSRGLRKAEQPPPAWYGRTPPRLTPTTGPCPILPPRSSIGAPILGSWDIPEREEDCLPPASALLEKQREVAEVEKTLLAQKEEFQIKMENLQVRWQELENKEMQLKEAVMKFDKFLKDNDAKRSRALQKAKAEKRQIALRGIEAEHLRQEIARLLSVKTKLQQRLESHKPFAEYLQKVLEKAEQFREIPEMISRFQTLLFVQAQQEQRELLCREAVEEEHARLKKYVEESSNQILWQNNQIAQLQAQLEQAQIRVHEGESIWNRIQNTAATKTLQVGQIKLAAWNLFQMVAKYRKLSVEVAQEDTEGQLDEIWLCMKDLMDILADFRKGDPQSVLNLEPSRTPQSELSKPYLASGRSTSTSIQKNKWTPTSP